MTTSQSISESYYREEKMMLSGTKKRIVYISCFFIACMVALFCLSPTGISSAATKQKGFSTAEDAVGALISALKDNNEEEMLAILGADAKELISSGDAVADREQRESFVEDYNRRNSLSEDGGKKVLVTGKQEWPFPIPLVKKDGRWFFDTSAGKEEILNRRIGRDERAGHYPDHACYRRRPEGVCHG